MNGEGARWRPPTSMLRAIGRRVGLTDCGVRPGPTRGRRLPGRPSRSYDGIQVAVGASTATVAAHALEVAKALTPHAKLLASAGYPDSFIADFTAQAQELADISNAVDRARQRRSRATVAIRQELKKAMGTVTVIEGVVMARSEHYSMAEWRLTRRVYARLGRPPERGKRRPAASPTESSAAGAE